jgi:hypothetical protein
MQIVITPGGEIRSLYHEAIDLAALGSLHVRRASRVEPNEEGRWTADLGPVAGPVLGPFRLRSQALLAEHEWLETHWLLSSGDTA